MKRLSVGERAPDFTIRDPRGDLLTLASVSSPLMLVFLRYLGCPFCREALSLLSARYLEIASQGVELWAFVPSSEEAAKEFAKKHNLPFRLLSDPARQVYRLYHVDEDRFYTGTLKGLSGQKLMEAAKLTLKHGHGMPEGTERQRTGAFLVDSEGILRYCFVAQSTLESVPLDDLMRAINGLPPRRVMGNS